MSKFKKLLEPGYIGKVRTRNRILKMGAEHTWFPYNDGYIDPRSYDFFEAVARGGAGLVEVNWADPDYPLGGNVNRGWRIDEDRFIQGQARLAEVIHKYNCPAFAQLHHSGPMMAGHLLGIQPVAASSLSKEENPHPNFDTARELTIPEIERIIEKFVNAALRYKKANFDGVTVNGGFAHLFNSFLSRAWNKRHDAYGADSLENRAKLMVEIIKGIKQAAGEDFAIISLFNGAEIGLKNGITIDESKGIAKLVEAAGANAIHIRLEYYLKRDSPNPSTHLPDLALYPDPLYPREKYVDASHHGAGAWVPAAAAIKQVVSLPIIAVGKLDPVMGEQVLRQRKADFIYMNRRIFADPELPNKVAQGRLSDIAPCTGCLSCFDAIERGLFSRCPANPSLGKEKEYEIKPAAQKRKVIVVGGGPTGMEAAFVAKLRGCEVTLFEKESKLGGSANIATVINGTNRENLGTLVLYLESQLDKNGVEIKKGVSVTRDLVKNIKPDVLILATGGKHNTPVIPGINRKNVLTSQSLHNRIMSIIRFCTPMIVRKLTNLYLPVGKKVVIIGGGMQGCQMAQFLVRRGRKASILEPGNEIGYGLVPTLVKPNLLNWLEQKGVSMMTGVKFQEITSNGIVIIGNNGHEENVEADTIITALPLLPDPEKLKSFEGTAPEIYSVGDCNKPQLVVDAIEEGARIGHHL